MGGFSPRRRSMRTGTAAIAPMSGAISTAASNYRDRVNFGDVAVSANISRIPIGTSERPSPYRVGAASIRRQWYFPPKQTMGILEYRPPSRLRSVTDVCASRELRGHRSIQLQKQTAVRPAPAHPTFGPVAAAIRYNFLSRLMASLEFRLFLIPAIRYFDSFGFLARASDSEATMEALVAMFDVVGITPALGKSTIAIADTFRVVSSKFPRVSNRTTIALSLETAKATGRSDMPAQLLGDGRISRASLEAMIGRLSFAHTAACGVFARSIPKPLRAILYSARYIAQLSPAIIRNLKWRAAISPALRRRITAISRPHPDWAIYTDASRGDIPGCARIASVFFFPDPLFSRGELLLYSNPGPDEILCFRGASVISGFDPPAVF